MTNRFYMVTFDLEDSKNRTNEYKAAEEALKFRFGPDNYWKILKQCCIVRTNRDAREIRDTLIQRLGQKCNILVIRLRRGYAFKIKDREKRTSAQSCLSQIPSI